MQSKPIRNSDFDAITAKHVTFFNEHFKRDRFDLLQKIQRSTRGGGSNSSQDQQREIQGLKEKVVSLENTIGEMGLQMEERMRRLELDMLSRMEQMMLAMQQQKQNHLLNKASGNNLLNEEAAKAAGVKGLAQMPGAASLANAQNLLKGFGGLDPAPYGARASSIGSISNLPGFAGFGDTSALDMPKTLSRGSGPTLPPHPKQKQLGAASNNLPGTLNIPHDRLTSLRGISNLTRGFSSLPRGASIESQSSALLNSAFEDKLLSMLMAGDNKAALNAAQLNLNNMNPTPMADNLAAIMNRQMAAANAATASGGSTIV
jgi:hypothetical protein